MGSFIVPEQEFDAVNYYEAAMKNEYFFRVTYTNKTQTVLSTIPVNGKITERTYKGADVTIDIYDGDATVVMSRLDESPRKTNVTKGQHLHVDEGEYFTIVNIGNKPLRMKLVFGIPVLHKGGVYPTDPNAGAVSVAVSPVPNRLSTQTIVIPEAPMPVPSVSVPTTTYVARPITTTTTPAPLSAPRGPLLITPAQPQVMAAESDRVVYRSAPSYMTQPQYLTRTSFVAAQPAPMSAESAGVPMLPTVKNTY